MNIRTATAHDAEALAILLDVLGFPVSPKDVPARLQRYEAEGNGRVLVAEADGPVVGFAAMEISHPIHYAAPVCHLSAFAVLPDYQGRGIGRGLLERVESIARRHGCRHMVVTSAEHRQDAHAFYQAIGWRYTGRRLGKDIKPEEDTG